MIDINKLSKEAQEMLAARKGFRNDALYGSGVENIRDIIEFEATELCNSDIFLTCERLYGIDYGELDLEDLEKTRICIEKTMEFLKNHFGTDELRGKWLGLKRDIIAYYEGENSLTEYPIPENAIIISDLGKEGVLFVTPNTWVDKDGYI